MLQRGHFDTYNTHKSFRDELRRRIHGYGRGFSGGHHRGPQQPQRRNGPRRRLRRRRHRVARRRAPRDVYAHRTHQVLHSDNGETFDDTVSQENDEGGDESLVGGSLEGAGENEQKRNVAVSAALSRAFGSCTGTGTDW